ncbi:terminase large subunit domain-containing protein [Nocardia sp. 348MFTsu5.1]|uniref:terminase large subunit domain-containing protein n=1 Tax=Nocardia sp. 348MFTsu5.1 TaxID=1172185 RepID=UPI00037CB39F|nr:terminase family protein [Nocardia sp. 348MFTsu5.1]
MTDDPTSRAAMTLVAARALAVARQRRRPATPAELAARLVPEYRITPAIALIGDALADAIRHPDRRLIITTPPRTGKSVLVSQVGTTFALARNPDARVILASYADSLAQEHSHAARALIAENAAALGFGISADKTAVGRWRVDGRGGGLLAAGILSGITGFGADLLLVDDPVKNAQDADSKSHRRNVLREFRSTLMTRLHPGASVVIIGTRWHEQDLIGTLLAEEPERWQHINIPAISESGVPDALGREPGVAMTSALGRTPEQFADIRAAVGSRTWHSLFQGVPTAPDGGLIKREWLDTWRLPVAPPRPVLTVVGVDPSDSGSGDSCGLVAASMTSDGVVSVIADVSAPMTSDAWARAAVDLAVAVGASEIAVEGFAARETYLRVVRDALRRAKLDRPVRVTTWPPKGSGRGGGDAVARSSALIQGLEVGTVRIAGHLPDLEQAAVTWQAGQHQPDQLAALVVAHDILTHAIGARMTFAAPRGLLGAGSGGSAAAVPTSIEGYRRRLGGGGYDPLLHVRHTR